MNGPFVKIVTASRSVYMNTDKIQTIEDDNGSIRIETECHTCEGVTQVNNVECKSIDDVAEELNNIIAPVEYDG